MGRRDGLAADYLPPPGGGNLDDLLFRNVRFEGKVAVESQMVETTVHHLGDQVLTSDLFALAPNPEGATWASDAFDLAAAAQAVEATITLDLVQSEFETNELREDHETIRWADIEPGTPRRVRPGELFRRASDRVDEPGSRPMAKRPPQSARFLAAPMALALAAPVAAEAPEQPLFRLHQKTTVG